MTKKLNLFIFEGIDGSGKSTLTNKFYDLLKDKNLGSAKKISPTDMIPMCRELVSGEIEMGPRVKKAMLQARYLEGEYNMATHDGVLRQYVKKGEYKNIVMDRYFPSLLYNFDLDTYYEIEKEIISMISDCYNIYIVYCRCDPDTAFNRINRRLEMQTKETRAHASRDFFERKDILADVCEKYEQAFRARECNNKGFQLIEINTGKFNPTGALHCLIDEWLLNDKGDDE